MFYTYVAQAGHPLCPLKENMAKKDKRNPFERTRDDHRAELREDYVEVIARLIAERGEARSVDIAQALGVSQTAVSAVIARLTKEGMVASEPYRSVFLTDKGARLARECTGRHELVKTFLCTIGVSEKTAEQDAEGIEHHLSPETIECLRRFLRKN